MKKNGAKITFIVIFVAISIYYLWPTFSLYLQNNYINGLPEAEQATYKENHTAKMKKLRENSLSLGLDLQGGMHVTLQMDTPQLVRELAGDYADSTLDRLISESSRQARENNSDFITVMMENFNQEHPNGQLSRYYRSESADITRRSSNSDIESYLKKQRKEAVGRALEIIRKRIDRFGVSEPSIEKLGNDRITVGLPGVADKQRVRNLLRGTARLQFRLTDDPQQLSNAQKKIVQYYNRQAAGDSTASSDSTADSSAQEQAAANNPLTQVLHFLRGNGQGHVVFGYAAAKDTARVNALLQVPDVQDLLPRNSTLMWTADAFNTGKNGEKLFRLVGIRKKVEITGEVITDASVNFDRQTNVPKVSMAMNAEGARKWARLTGANIGKPVAIILDGYVYSFPNVETKISGGRSEITGINSVNEAKDLVNILLSGALPAPLKIVQQRTVGPSLGEASIHAGLYSVIIAFLVVIIFMILYYHWAGLVADIAVIFCLLFIVGVLAAFHATLTLPGIAGIVLTIGIAVDANVLIYDRVQIELRGGKTFHAAIDTGYKLAMSAIIDGHVTTLLTAIVLFIFGTGPIKGFAITLMAGVICSLFSNVVITRVIIDYMARDKTKTFSFG
jgi:preprotein translocase subunit SecD